MGSALFNFQLNFCSDGEVDLKSFRSYNIHEFDLEKHGEIFAKENIEYLPTLILYQNGKEIKRIEAGISLKLDDECIGIMQKENRWIIIFQILILMIMDANAQIKKRS